VESRSSYGVAEWTATHAIRALTVAVVAQDSRYRSTIGFRRERFLDRDVSGADKQLTVGAARRILCAALFFQ